MIGDSPPSLQQIFADPPAAFSPTPSWLWAGDHLRLDRLRWQLDRFAEAEIANVIVISFPPVGPTMGMRAFDPLWFSDEWWELFRATCDGARARGLSIWFYDQIGFGGGHLQGRLVSANPRFRGEAIERIALETTESCRIDCPKGGRPVAGAALPIDDDGAPIGPPIVLRVENDSVQWRGSTRHRVLLVYTRPRGFDYLSSAACGALLDSVHGEFERRVPEFLGSVIVGSYQDELPGINHWSTSFLEAFRRQHGYDLTKYVVALWEDWGRDARKVRGDYYATRAALAEEAWFRPLFDWHERHGMIVGCDQHSPARAGFPIGSTQLYGNYVSTHRWFSAPGSDHWGDAKLHSSLAHLYERPRVWLEAFHSSGWGGTIEETFDWLMPWLRAGVTLYNPHEIAYTTRGGWLEFAPPSTCWRQPYWRHYSQFAGAVSRMCAVLSQGVHDCEVAVIFPVATAQANIPVDVPILGAFGPAEYPEAIETARRAEQTYLELVGKMHWGSTQPGVLDRDRRDFDIIDEASIQRAEVGDGALAVSGERYKAVIIPSCEVLEEATLVALRQFAEAGGTVIAVEVLPSVAAGLNGRDEEAELLAKLHDVGKVHLVDRASDVPSALGDIPRRVEAPVPTLLRRVDDRYVLLIPAAYPNATTNPILPMRLEASTEFDVVTVQDYDFDSARYAREMTVVVRGINGTPELWDPFSGDRRAVDWRRLDDGSMEILVRFDGGPVAMIVFGAEILTQLGKPVSSGSEQETIGLDGEWECELIPTLDNQWGDFSLPEHPGSPPVQTWVLRHKADPEDEGLNRGWHKAESDDSAWPLTCATYGPRGTRVGPLPLDELPDPLTKAETAAVINGERALGVTGWEPAVYSLSRGIYKDKLHLAFLGMRGLVPDEFLHWANPGPGSGVQMRTLIVGPAQTPSTVCLVIGAAARKMAWWNGSPLPDDDGGYLYFAPLEVRKGLNVLEFRLSESEAPPAILTGDSELRAFWALVDDPAAFARPEWLAPDDDAAAGTSVSYSLAFDLPFEPTSAYLHVGTTGSVSVTINETPVGRQGEFHYYDGLLDVGPAEFVRYNILSEVRVGLNRISIESEDSGRHVPVFVDAVVEDSSGQRLHVSSNRDWDLSRDGRPVALRLVREQSYDSHYPVVSARPHPLPGASWLEGKANRGHVLPVEAALAVKSHVEWFRFVVPPGTTEIHLPIEGDVSCFIDGVPSTVGSGLVTVPPDDLGPRTCAVRVVPKGYRSGGALWKGPATFTVGTGRIPVGSWHRLGLPGYSGGMKYRRQIELPEASRLLLDLGRVRGTVEVQVNGRVVGIRVCPPWEFNISEFVRAGLNELEIIVFNTLGPFLNETTPTGFVKPSQMVSGLLGPVALRMTTRG